MKFATSPTHYTSFDGGVSLSTLCRRPDRYAFFNEKDFGQNSISRGAGLSYCAASFSQSSVSIEHAEFNRLLSFSAEDAALEVEAGVTLGQIEAFLSPRGFYLPVQPGHPSISVGGCIAADVHGKNQFLDGTFSAHVKNLTLSHPAHGILKLSRTEDDAVFKLTCGGYGLTGHILSATLALKKIQAPFVRLSVSPIENLESLPAILKDAAARSDLVYTWHDFTARGESFGRGVLTEGRFASKEECETLPAKAGHRKVSELSARARGAWRAAFFNGLTTPLFNRAFGWTQRHGTRSRFQPLYDFLFPVHNKEAYFKLFGARGFLECQMIVPVESYVEFAGRLRKRLNDESIPVTLASAKLFRGTRELLRFTGEGICLALNFPRSTRGVRFAEFLDELLPSVNGFPNIIKDSRLPRSVVEKTYPDCGQFRQRLRTFDPERLCRSELSERLGL